MGSWVWEVLTLPKIKCFLWQCVHQSIVVRVVLIEWGCNLSSLHPLCNEAIKSIIHVLRDCPKAHLLWNSFPPPIQSNTFYGVHLGDWLRINCKSQHPSLLGIPWSIMFSFGIWSIWLHRNNVIFINGPPYKPLLAGTLAKATEYAFLGINGRPRCSFSSILVKWLRPPENWFKLNSNGSSFGNLGCAIGGGIIRNSNGKWVSKLWETAPSARFIECWAKLTWMGGVMLLSLKMEVQLVITISI